MKKGVNILSKNQVYMDRLVYSLYGSPISWAGSSRLIVKGCPGFEIRSEKSFFDDDYNHKIIFGNSISKDEMQYLTKLARTKDLSCSDVDEIIHEAKKNLYHKLEGIRK